MSPSATQNPSDSTQTSVLRNSSFVLALARAEMHTTFPDLWSERSLLEIRLGALSSRDAERLVRHALGEGADAAVVKRMVERAEGECLLPRRADPERGGGSG